MLSTSPIKNNQNATQYFFSHDEYYFQDSMEQAWYGKGAEALELGKNIAQEKFSQLLAGKLPNGQQLGRIDSGQIKHRPGYDLTFNAPKSVSLLAMLGQDKRLLKAHGQAVGVALDTIEKDCAQARVTEKGKTRFECTSNLVVATFRHELSRAGDPHLHTHCIVMNATRCADDKWRSLASNRDPTTRDHFGFWEQIIEHQRYYGMIYRAELAYQVHQLGYSVHKTGDRYCFEIGGVGQEVIRAFSQRRKEIEGYLMRHGKQGAKESALATLATRQAKIARDRNQLRILWQERAAFHDFKPEHLIESTNQQSRVLQSGSANPLSMQSIPSAEVYQIVRDVLATMERSHVRLSESQLIQKCLDIGSEKVIRVSEIITVIDELTQCNELVVLPGERGSYTTPKLLDQQQQLKQFLQNGEQTTQSIFPKNHFKLWLSRNPDCNSFEEKSLLQIFSTKGQYQGILGLDGDSKTRLINHIKHLSNLAEVCPILLSPDYNHSRKLKDQYQVTSLTLDRFIQNMDDGKKSWQLNRGKHLLVVDSVQQVTVSQLSNIVHKIDKTKVKIVFLGNLAHAAKAEHAGALQLLKNSIPIIDFIRQDTPQENMPETPDGNIKGFKGNFDLQGTLQNALTYAIAHLSEREAVFDDQTLKATVLEYGIGSISPGNLEKIWLSKLIPDAKQKGLLLEAHKDRQAFWTTPKSLKLEQEIVKLAKTGQEQCQPITKLSLVEDFLVESKLNGEQQQAVKLMMTHSHRFILIQGLAGTGKTMTMGVAQSFLDQQNTGIRIVGLAPTHRAVNVLAKQGIASQTLQGFLSDHQMNTDGAQPSQHQRSILLLDEASMVSNQQMHDFLSVCYETDARAIIMGDQRQLPAIEAGKPFALLQQLDIPIAYLTQTHRYENESLKAAVSAIHQGDIQQAFELLDADIYADKSADEMLASIVKDYSQSSTKNRHNLQLITPAHRDRELVNQLVRQSLTNQAALDKNFVSVNILVNQNLTAAQRSQIDNYQLGNMLYFHTDNNALQISKGSYLQVTEQIPEKNALVITNEQGKCFYWPLPLLNSQDCQRIEVYQQQKRELRVSDEIFWTRTDPKNKLLSGDHATVYEIINAHEIKVKLANGEFQSLDLTNPSKLHFDYAYAATAHRVQGTTVKETHLVLHSYQKNLANQNTFLVAISRAVSKSSIYTDDKARLLDRLIANKGGKTSSLEAMGQLHQPTSKSRPQSLPKLKTRILGTQYFGQSMQLSWLSKDFSQSMPSLLKNILGQEPKRKTSEYCFYGRNKGSLVVRIAGEKQGLWYDFQTGEGGNLLQLIQTKLGINFKQALAYVHNHNQIGGYKGNLQPIKSEEQLTIPNKPRLHDNNHYPRNRLAQVLYAQSQPIKGTLAERYLREHRGIQGKLPESLRFHASVYSKINNITAPALLAVARDQRGIIQSVQATYLDQLTAGKAVLPVQKQTFGPIKGASVPLSNIVNRGNNFIFYAEGVETGLSILEAFPRANIQALLGAANFKNICDQRIAKHVVLCLDNDGPNTVVNGIYVDTVQKLTQAGHDVWLAKPGQVGSDFNDLLLSEGRSSVYQKIIASNLYSSIGISKSLYELVHEYKVLSTNSHDHPKIQTIKADRSNSQQKMNLTSKNNSLKLSYEPSVKDHQQSKTQNLKTSKNERLSKTMSQEFTFERER